MSTDDKAPTQGEIHIQMMRTMKALERWAEASIAFMGAASESKQAPSKPEHWRNVSVESKQTPTLPTPPSLPLDGDLEKIRAELLAHRKALALINTFGQFKDVGFLGTNPANAVQHLVRLRACSCVGTGWVARDESCSACKMKGYIES